MYPSPTGQRSSSRPRSQRSFAVAAALIAATFMLIAGCSSSGSSGSSGGGGSSGGSSGGGGGGTKVTATETEFHIALSRSSFTPGKYTFTAVNKGQLSHDLIINGPGVSKVQAPSQGLIAPGQSASMTVTLSKGTYDIYCGVPGHKQQGMDVHIKVS